MSLYEDLAKIKTEEDVKDAYIRALNLKGVQKNLVDIQTKEIWFEAKRHPTPINTMFTQLLHYVQVAINKGDAIPPFLCVIDNEKAAIMKTDVVYDFLSKKTIKWGKSASIVPQDALDIVSSFIATHFVQFIIKDDEKDFIYAIKNAITHSEILRISIQPSNLKNVFDKWVNMIGSKIRDISDEHLALLFYADIMHDGSTQQIADFSAKLYFDGSNPNFFFNGKMYPVFDVASYFNFWRIHHRPPKIEHRAILLERRDSLLPLDEMKFKGAYYTPLSFVSKAYEYLDRILGSDWQTEYILWDNCCGVGNLESKHSYHRNVFMSTLDQADIDIMFSSRICSGAKRFQYDYLNDDVTDFATIEYTSNKIPDNLKLILDQAKQNKGKPLLILINPPYAEASESGIDSKSGVAKTRWAESCMDGWGKSSNELFTQFLSRLSVEAPNAIIAMFSTLKYVNAPNFEEFRKKWNSTFLGGFVFHSKNFESLKGNFPIGFCIWKTSDISLKKYEPISQIELDVLDTSGCFIGKKSFHNIPQQKLLNSWIARPKTNSFKVVPLKNAITPASSSPRVDTWSENAIGYMNCAGNDMQQATKLTTLFSSVFSNGNGFYVTSDNLLKASMIFAVRKLIEPHWLNNRDQFLQPNIKPTKEFEIDCLIFMLFHSSNLTASAIDLDWDNQKWNITNHFIPYSENEVGASDQFDSDFMFLFLKKQTLSAEAQDVLNKGRDVWIAYHKGNDDLRTKELLKLNNSSVGWYQIRNALKTRQTFDFSDFENAYKNLAEKLRPLVFHFGFMI
jgi:hypothetical protein